MKVQQQKKEISGISALLIWGLITAELIAGFFISVG